MADPKVLLALCVEAVWSVKECGILENFYTCNSLCMMKRVSTLWSAQLNVADKPFKGLLLCNIVLKNCEDLLCSHLL